MKILAFGAHPDDIEIGMGGTITKYTKNNHQVLLVVVTVPSDSYEREYEALKAADILGAKLMMLKLEPSRLLFNRELVRTFDVIIDDFLPDEVYTHWDHDSHQDHNFVTSAVIASARKNSFSLYMYEQTIPGGITPVSFYPQMYIDISEEIDIKLKSVQAHKSQLERNKEGWIYGIKGRAQFRGYQIGTRFAEAFQVIKEIRKI